MKASLFAVGFALAFSSQAQAMLSDRCNFAYERVSSGLETMSFLQKRLSESPSTSEIDKIYKRLEQESVVIASLSQVYTSFCKR